jgi:hypothetical protein
MPKTIEINCPECEAVLVIDTENGIIVEHNKKPKPKPSLDDFIQAQKKRPAELEQKFLKAKEKEAAKKAAIEAKFNELRKNKEKYDSDKPPETGINWD